MGKPALENCLNTHCPWSGKPVAADSLTEYRGHVVGFCNPDCRDKFRRAADAFDDLLSAKAQQPRSAKANQGKDRQILFETGDEVWFLISTGDRRRGEVEKLNPKRAKVRCADGAWNVPYRGLHHVDETLAREREFRSRRLAEVGAQARGLMDLHGLAEWSFDYIAAEKKLGVCRHRQRQIQLSRKHALEDSEEQVIDTVLHEIAHALAGPDAGHGPRWKAIARRLGATPKARAPESEEMREERECAKIRFRNGDQVRFEHGGEMVAGVIERMNPKRAKVRRADGTVWMVPYVKLHPAP